MNRIRDCDASHGAWGTAGNTLKSQRTARAKTFCEIDFSCCGWSFIVNISHEKPVRGRAWPEPEHSPPDNVTGYSLATICSASELFGLASIPPSPDTPVIGRPIGKVNPFFAPDPNTVFTPSAKKCLKRLSP